jgi:hypothetical protein
LHPAWLTDAVHGTYSSRSSSATPLQYEYIANEYSLTGAGSAQKLNYVDISFDVNFQTGSISNGSLKLSTDSAGATRNWIASGFGGVLDGSSLTFDFSAAQSHYADGTTRHALSALVMQGSLVRNDDGTNDNEETKGSGFIGGLYMESSAAGKYLSGVFAARAENLNFIDKRLSEYSTDANGKYTGLSKSFTGVGLILPTNARNTVLSDGNNPRDTYFGFATDTDELRFNPVFATTFKPGDLAAGPDRSTFDKVFRIGQATASNQAVFVNYGVSWGIWNKGFAQVGATSQIDARDPALVEQRYDNLVWAVVDNFELARPSGVYTYAKTLNWIGESSSGLPITAITSVFDVSFDQATSVAQEGYFKICVGGSSGCTGASVWESERFFASLDGGMLRSLSLHGKITPSSATTESTTFSGSFLGRFVGATTAGKNDALLGGFNLYDDGNDDSFLTGFFLSQREERFDPDFDTGSLDALAGIAKRPTKALIYEPAVAGITANLRGSGTAGNAGLDISFLPASGDGLVFNLGNRTEQAIYSQFTHGDGKSTEYRMELGYWNKPGIAAALNNNLRGTSLSTSFVLADAGVWINYDTMDLSMFQVGRFSSRLTSAEMSEVTHFSRAGEHMLNGAVVSSIDWMHVSFDINFSSGSVSKGKLQLGTSGTTTSGYTWNVDFAGSTSRGTLLLNDNTLILRGGAVTGSVKDNASGSTYTLNAKNSIIAGGILPGHADDELIFSGLYHLEAGTSTTSHSANGQFRTDGFGFTGSESTLDYRITVDDQLRMKTSPYVAMSVNPENGILFGRARRSMQSGDAPILSWDKADTDLKPDLAVTPKTIARSADNRGPHANGFSIDGMELDWGRWDNTEVLLDESPLNPTRISAPGTDIEWAVFKPADMSSKTGRASYTVSRFTGQAENGGAISEIKMDFDVNLAGGTSAISNGQLRVVEGNTSNWSVTFSGDVAGAYATMKGISGTFTGTGISQTVDQASMRGAFVGTGSTPDFLTGFVLQSRTDSVQGLILSEPKP